MNREQLSTVLVSPRVSEKTARLADSANQYVFDVSKTATKPDIKKAVEVMFDVEVASVQVANLKGKTKVFKRRTGKRSDVKKAYVRLKPGSEIEFIAPE
ncbi:MAG: 50S ribosomal protein L23 [Gammaproteobacteria bacterium]